MRILFLICAFALSACASTNFRIVNPKTGKVQKVASFQGDMENVSMTYVASADGAVSITWTADKVNHSEPTRAQGDSAAAKLTAVAGVAAAVGTAIATSGMLP